MVTCYSDGTVAVANHLRLSLVPRPLFPVFWVGKKVYENLASVGLAQAWKPEEVE